MSTPSALGAHPPLTEQIKERALEFVQHSQEAVTSFAWLWPLRGVVFAVSNPRVFASARPAILKSLGISVAIFGGLLFLTYLPQAAILSLFTGPFGPFLALILVLAESVLLLTVFARALFLGPALSEVFDATLRAQGQAQLVATGRRTLGGGGRTGDVGKALVKPLQGFTFDGILRYIVTLPLNFIPVVGTAFFLLYNGHKGGPGWHARYFQLKGLDKARKQAFVEKHQPEYTAFGAATLLLNFVPFVGLLFAFTNTVAAALWAAEIEARQNVLEPEVRKTQ